MIGLEKITDKIIADAKAKADEIIAEANGRCEQILLECEEKKARIAQRLEDDAIREGESIKARAMSEVAKSSRDSALALRANLIDEAFDIARQAVLALDGDRYIQLMSGLLSRVLRERAESEADSIRLYGEDISPERYEVRLNKNDRDRYGKLIIDGARRAVVGKVKSSMLDRVCLSDDYVNIGGGFVVRCGDVELNCSLETVIAELRPQLEMRVAEILFPADDKENKRD